MKASGPIRSHVCRSTLIVVRVFFAVSFSTSKSGGMAYGKIIGPQKGVPKMGPNGPQIKGTPLFGAHLCPFWGPLFGALLFCCMPCPLVPCTPVGISDGMGPMDLSLAFNGLRKTWFELKFAELSFAHLD